MCELFGNEKNSVEWGLIRKCSISLSENVGYPGWQTKKMFQLKIAYNHQKHQGYLREKLNYLENIYYL